MEKLTNKFKRKIQEWSKKNFLQVAVFNIIMLILFLLRSAGYFEPYLAVSVNLIVIIGILLLIVLFGAGSRELFGFSLVFWLFASILKLFGIDRWAERTVVYTYEILVIGLVLTFLELFRERFGKK